MSDDTKKMPKLGRRDSLKLATAVTALGAGLGVVLDGDEASAQIYKFRSSDIGNFTVKLYKFDAEGKAHTLVETVDLGALAIKLGKGGAYSVKMFNQKGDAAVMVSEHAIAVEPSKIAPVAPVAPIQAPATLKR
jgi:hypothetical protein